MEDKNKKEEKQNLIEEKSVEEKSMQEMLQEALEISKKNQKDIRYIKRFVIWSQVWGALKILLILVPIILGILYLPPFLEQWLGSYQGMLNGSGATSGNTILDNLIK